MSERRTLWGSGQAEALPFLARQEAQDREADLALLPHDARATVAHVCALHRLGALTSTERRTLATVLEEIVRRPPARLPDDVEDGPMWLESQLVAKCGSLGASIHLGRSRNDQTATALRLFERLGLLDLHDRVLDAADAFWVWGERHAAQPLPGYTHGRLAMPSSCRQWALTQLAVLVDGLEALEAVDGRLDRCPLGAAAGFGAPLPLDRDYTARLLGFSRIALSPQDAVGGDRVRGAIALTEALAVIATGLESMMADLLLWSGEGLRLVRLGDALTTGSSLMPQKRNPDVLELARAELRFLRLYPQLLAGITAGLPSGYQRDLQRTKPLVVAALDTARNVLDLVPRLLAEVVPDPAAIDRALRPEAHAARSACLRAWRQRRPFRDCYREVREEILGGGFIPPSPEDDPGEAVGAPSRPSLDRWTSALDAHRAWGRTRRESERMAERFLWKEALAP